MEHLALLLQNHGYALLFATGFLEYIGAPIAGVPILVVAGALGSMGGLPLPGIIAAAALGGLASDLIWYTAARKRGRSLVDVVCGLSTNPMACVIGVERRIQAVGSLYLIPSKFLPGVGNLAAAASGFAGMPAGRFLFLDTVALVLWAGVYGGVGWLFSSQVEEVMARLSDVGLLAILIAVGLVSGAGVWRFAKVRMHRSHHEAARADQSSKSPPRT